MGGVKRKNVDKTGNANKKVKKAHIKDAKSVKVDFQNNIWVIFSAQNAIPLASIWKSC